MENEGVIRDAGRSNTPKELLNMGVPAAYKHNFAFRAPHHTIPWLGIFHCFFCEQTAPVDTMLTIDVDLACYLLGQGQHALRQ